MIVGTASNVGKSIICTALCRIFTQDGLQTAPFKAQNMSLNSAVTPSGREIGRAQAVQAEAAGILPNEHMNPVLLKPTGHRTQVVVQGQVYDTVSAQRYFSSNKARLWDAVVESYHFLSKRYDLIIMEGAGSPVEMNLKERDIANLKAAELADACVVLVADIDRGGVFASVVGTLQLMTEEERQRVKGVIINRFRGDPELFDDGVRLLESYTGIPVIGVIPYVANIGIEEEDSMGLERFRESTERQTNDHRLRIGIIKLPHISNFTDFDPLFLEPDVDASFVTSPHQLSDVDVVVLPGTKNTMSDLLWLWESGLAEFLQGMDESKQFLLGICGGYQMMGERIRDPYHQEEEDIDEAVALGLFPFETVLTKEKQTVLVEGDLSKIYAGIKVTGYELHMGRTTHLQSLRPFARIRPAQHSDNGQVEITQGDTLQTRQGGAVDGVVSENGKTIGTYLHGILHNDEFRMSWLNRVRASRGLPPRSQSILVSQSREAAYNSLANTVRQHLNFSLLYEFLR
ncbi:cobyric acid synthase [Alicyclobacillus sp. SO9]|nr:cobyric acid synthase [Alicyclobacillus sp. SO9]